MARARLGLGVVMAVTLLAGGVIPELEGCTGLVAAGAATSAGAPVLWKNRDTATLSNKVVFVEESPHGYLCLANADSASGRFCYAGLNTAGFAVMNTVAYNLPLKRGEMADLEGQLMAEALRVCRTVEDFARFLDRNVGPDLGSQATFGVFDATGAAVLFEVHNHGYRRLDAAAAPAARLVVTNFARSGPEGEGAGYLRFERASELVAGFGAEEVDPLVILHRFTRDIGHPLLEHPSLESLAGQPAVPARWIVSRDCINRPSTASATVLVGAVAGAPDRPAVMWVIPGEPVTAVAIPLFAAAGTVPAAVHAGEEAPLWAASARLKAVLRPRRGGNQQDYMDLTRLDNGDGTGFLPGLLAAEREIFAETEAFLAEPRNAVELAEFQERMASKALAVMTAAAERVEPEKTRMK